MSENQESETIINKENFRQYFKDIRHHRPERGDIMAKFTAIALFGEGREKRDIIRILTMDKAKAAAKVMQKIHYAKEPDCYRVCREICEDLLKGMTVEQVDKKDYEFVLEICYYTKKEYVPKNNQHWETIQLIEYDSETKQFRSRIEV